jgi:5-methylcytosine-specific restriction protein A
MAWGCKTEERVVGMRRFFRVSLYVLGWLTALFLVHSFVPKGNEFLSWLSGFGAGFGGLTGASAILGVFYSKSVKDKKEMAKSEEGKAKFQKETVELQTTLSPVRRGFIEALEAMFSEAAKQGESSCIVNSGELHRTVGGYPGQNHHMPVCCSVMYAEMQEGRDEIVESPPKGKGASLTIKYQLPRLTWP